MSYWFASFLFISHFIMNVMDACEEKPNRPRNVTFTFIFENNSPDYGGDGCRWCDRKSMITAPAPRSLVICHSPAAAFDCDFDDEQLLHLLLDWSMQVIFPNRKKSSQGPALVSCQIYRLNCCSSGFPVLASPVLRWLFSQYQQDQKAQEGSQAGCGSDLSLFLRALFSPFLLST